MHVLYGIKCCCGTACVCYASRPVLTPVLESYAARAFSDRHNIVLSCQQSPALPASIQHSLQAKDDRLQLMLMPQLCLARQEAAYCTGRTQHTIVCNVLYDRVCMQPQASPCTAICDDGGYCIHVSGHSTPNVYLVGRL